MKSLYVAILKKVSTLDLKFGKKYKVCFINGMISRTDCASFLLFSLLGIALLRIKMLLLFFCCSARSKRRPHFYSVCNSSQRILASSDGRTLCFK